MTKPANASPARTLTLIGALLVASACQSVLPARPSHQPASSPAQVRLQEQAMVAAADPRAVEAGLDVLAAGGSAVDAAIAVQMVLGLVEPQSSGIGGGAFLLHFDAARRAMTFYDGRETAPAGAQAEMFLGADGKPLAFLDAVTGGTSIGVPGVIAMLDMAHRDHGNLPWASGFVAAEKLAREGYQLTSRTSGFVASLMSYPGGLQADAQARALFLDAGGAPLPAGTIVRNAGYARTMADIAAHGAKAFYSGQIAQGILEDANRAPRAGSLAASDLAAYRPIKRQALCAPFRDKTVCTSPPPGSGVAVLQVLDLYARLQPANAPADARALSVFIEAQKAAYADRDHYIADADIVPVPVADLLDPRYLASRASAIDPASGGQAWRAGDPARATGNATPFDSWGRDQTQEARGTSHFVIVDARGNVVSMTTTVENVFGSQRMTSGGFFLNNQLTDFALAPTRNGKPLANAVAPGKRPRSSMSPTIVLDAQGRFLFATGSPGGSAIIGYVAKSILGVLEWGQTPQQAADSANIIARAPAARAETSRMDPATITALAAMGQKLDAMQGEQSGIHSVLAGPQGYLGAADPRRLGIARSIDLSVITPAPAR